MSECTVCLEPVPLNSSATLLCSHVFHFECIVNWCDVNPSCPNCKQKIFKITYNGKAQPIAPKRNRNIQIEESSLIFCQFCSQECNLRSQIQDFLPCLANCGEHIHKACSTQVSRTRWLCVDCTDLKERRRQEQVIRSGIDLDRKKLAASKLDNSTIPEPIAHSSPVIEETTDVAPKPPLSHQEIWDQYYKVLAKTNTTSSLPRTPSVNSSSSRSTSVQSTPTAVSYNTNRSSNSSSKVTNLGVTRTMSTSSSGSYHNNNKNSVMQMVISKHSPVVPKPIIPQNTIANTITSNYNKTISNSKLSTAAPMKPIVKASIINVTATDDDDNNSDDEVFEFKLPAKGQVIRSEYDRSTILSVLDKKRKPVSSLAESVKRELKSKKS